MGKKRPRLETKQGALAGVVFVLTIEIYLPFLEGPPFWALHAFFLWVLFISAYTLGWWTGREAAKQEEDPPS